MSKTIKFQNKYMGKLVDVEPGWGFPGECVSLVQRFIIEELGVKAKARGNGKDWRTTLINEGLGHRVERKDIRIGDIIAWDGRLGHVAIALGGDVILEQIGPGGRTKLGSIIYWDKAQNSKGLVTRLNDFVDQDTTKKKTINEVAKEIWKGLWGDGEVRKKLLKEAGYDYKEVQAEVDRVNPSGSYDPEAPKQDRPKFKPYKHVIPKNSLLYRANGTAHGIKTTVNHTVTILEEKNGLGRFEASWLKGVSEAWTKLQKQDNTTTSKPAPKPKPKTVKIGGRTRLFVASGGTATYPQVPKKTYNHYTNLKTRTVDVVDEVASRVRVRIPGFNPNLIWINKTELK